MHEPANSQPSINTRRFTRLYILALTLVAVLTLAGQAVVQLSLSTLQGDTTTVNVAGRQRMLSQRIPRIALQVADENSPKRRRALLDELQSLLEVWKSNHSNLVRGATDVGLSGSNSREVSALLNQIEPHVQRLSQLIERLLVHDWHASPEAADFDWPSMLHSSNAFLTGMDSVVSLYTGEARQRVAKLRWVERGLLLATLLVLVCEGCFIFSPAVASLERAFQRLRAVSQQLKIAKETAENANNAKTQFLARVSHELRTPLHAIAGMLTLIRRGALSVAQRKRVTVAHRSTRILRRLVDDLLDLASDAAGNAWQLHVSAVNVRLLIHDCCRLMRPLAQRKHLTLTAQIQLPHDRWLVDEFRLQQIVINLLQNAIRYTQSGGIECDSRLERRAEQEWLCIEIRDTGCGIAPEHHARIFESFVRLDLDRPSSISGARMGLGLPITASLVATMRGLISVRSQPKQGSTFTIELPVERAEADNTGETADTADTAQSTELQSGSEGKHAAALPGPPVRPSGVQESDGSSRPFGVEEGESFSPAGRSTSALIVDDAPTNRRLMREYLRCFNIRATMARDHEQAWQVLERTSPHLILLDLHVGEDDTLTFLRKIAQRKIFPRPRIVIVTADIYFSLGNLPADVSVDCVLRKPLDLEVLQTELERAGLLRNVSPHPRAPEPDASSEMEFAHLKAELKAALAARLPDELTALKQACTRCDLGAVQLIAHRVRGSASNAGWADLAELAAQMETCQEAGGWGVALIKLESFINNLNKVTRLQSR